MLEHINPTFSQGGPAQIRSPHRSDDRKQLHVTILWMVLGFAALLVLLIVFGGNSAGGYNRSLTPTFAVVDPIE